MPLLPLGPTAMPPSDPRARELMRVRAKIKDALAAASGWNELEPLSATELYAPDAGSGLPIEAWIERVLHPRLRLIAGGMMPYPDSSDLASTYERDAAGGPDAELLAAVRELDAIFSR